MPQLPHQKLESETSRDLIMPKQKTLTELLKEKILNSLCFQCPKCVTCEKCRKLLALIVEANKEWLEQYKESLEEMEGSWTISGATTLCNNLLKELK